MAAKPSDKKSEQFPEKGQHISETWSRGNACTVPLGVHSPRLHSLSL